jgi:hypothetical protein
MKRALFLLLFLCVAARAEVPGRLPWNPFEGARAGDQASYVTTLTAEGAEGTAVVSSDRIAWTIASVSSERVVVRSSDGNERAFRAGVAPTVAEFLDLRPGEEPGPLAVTEESRPAVGRTFACTKVSFSLGDAMGRSEEVALWLSREVPAVRIVAMRWRRSPRPGVAETVTLELER